MQQLRQFSKIHSITEFVSQNTEIIATNTLVSFQKSYSIDAKMYAGENTGDLKKSQQREILYFEEF